MTNKFSFPSFILLFNLFWEKLIFFKSVELYLFPKKIAVTAALETL